MAKSKNPQQSYEKYIDQNIQNYKFSDFKKALSDFLKKYGRSISREYQNILQKAVEWEMQANTEGSFTLSMIKEKILRLDVALCLSQEGGMGLLGDYASLFPQHTGGICDSLKLLLKVDKAFQVDAILHLCENYNEITLKLEGFSLDLQIDESQAMLTVKSKADSNLAKKCFSLFSLLNSTNIFQHLPEQEILIEILSLLKENYTQEPSLQKQGILITLLTSSTGFNLKFLQGESNRMFLKSQKMEDKLEIEFLSDIPCHPNTQKSLFKLIGMFFSSPQKKPFENNWRFSCFEAISQCMAELPPRIKFDLGTSGDFWKAAFLSEALGEHVISAKAQQCLRSGADEISISPNGREIRLLKNAPLGLKIEEAFRLDQELQELEEKVALQKVDEAKADKAKKRIVKMEEVYKKAIEEAIRSYDEKHEGEEELQPHQPKTISQALRTNWRKSEEYGIASKKMRNAIVYGLACLGLVVFALIFAFFMSEPQPVQSKLILTESDSSYFIAPSGSPEDKPKDPFPPNPLQDVIQEMSLQINLAVPPSQEMMNFLLRRIEDGGDEFKKNPDILNLIGRLYWYKIYTDMRGERIFVDNSAYEGLDLFPDWIEIWKKEAVNAFSKAKKMYREKSYRPSVKIIIHDWKPELEFYPNTSEIHYGTPEEASLEMEKMAVEVGKMIDRMRTKSKKP